MNAPGLTLGLANEQGTVLTRGFGYSNLDTRAPVTPDLLFEIGSITKSFTAIVILQLHEQGKIDLHKPVLDYLPWLPIESNYGPISIHHLLTHTSGLPDALSLFASDPRARLLQTSRPGERFHYCNAGFDTLGYLIESLDKRTFAESVQARILLPLGMTSSVAAITNETRERRARSYVPLYDDFTYPQKGKLAPAPDLVFSNAAGCISSTPADMTRYMQMLLRRGVGPGSRILTEASFALLSKPYIKAAEFGPTASYGYGIAIDKLDGHTVLRHTGGMVSFASSMHVDLDGGVAAFASINAMQGYRPTAVTQFAIQVLRAEREAKAPPMPPVLVDPAIVANADRFAGVYRSSDGQELVVTARGNKLDIRAGALTSSLEIAGGTSFGATNPELARFLWVFGPGEVPKGATAQQKESAQIVEVRNGSEWYTNERYSGPKEFAQVAGHEAYIGHYRGESPWVGSIRVVACKGRLWLDGTSPLETLGNHLFRIGGEEGGSETVEFFHLADGKARLLKMAGGDLWRVNAA